MPNVLAIYCNNDRSTSYSDARKLLILSVEQHGRALIASVCSPEGKVQSVDVALLKRFKVSKCDPNYLKTPTDDPITLKLLYAPKDMLRAKNMIDILTNYRNAKLKLMEG